MSITQGPKYMYERLVPKWKAWRLSEPEKYGKGFIGLLKNAYGEVSYTIIQQGCWGVSMRIINRGEGGGLMLSLIHI